MNILAWALKLLALVPYIANGVHTVHNDLTLGGKVSAAQDALQLATAGAVSLLPAEDQQLAAGIGAVASKSLTDTVTALHNASQPAAQPAA